jgi:hypothetical protein
MALIKYFMQSILVYLTIISSSLQAQPLTKSVADDVFVGSTSCIPQIRSLLKIPSTDTCVYIKWELNMFNKQNQANSFKLFISYGDYLPNTMYFLRGGKDMSITGKLTTSYVTRGNSLYKVYHLVADKDRPEILLLAMDNNILHLIDSNMKFIKGDESFGCILNRLSDITTN